MVIASIAFFFVMLWGTGFSLSLFLKEAENPLERNVMRLGFGLMLFPILAVLLSILRVPLDWRVFLALSLAAPLIAVIRQRRIAVPRISLTYANISILAAFLIFFVSLYIYASGAFAYPYLEDDDPWAHAVGAKYVSLQKVAFASPNAPLHYLDPYPPGYDSLMGVLHQTNDSIYWTLKFFNALIISLGILFFYFAALRLSGSRGKALFAAFVLASVPAYLSHFIWSHALVVTLFFPALYALLMMQHDRRWLVPASLGIGAFAMVQPTQPIKLTIMLGLYIAVLLAVHRKLLWQYLAVPFLGVAVALLWWWPRWRGYFFSANEFLSGYGLGVKTTGNLFAKIWSAVITAFPAGSGTASRPYTFGDFFIAKSQNMINNPIGIGIVISLLVLLGLVAIVLQHRSLLQQKKAYLLVSSLWLLFTFLGVNSITFNLPVGLFAFRFWMLLAIPVALLAAEGMWLILSLAKQLRVPFAVPALILLVSLGVIFTGGVQKHDVNTANWPPGAFWTSVDEVQAYLWLRTLPSDTRVFGFSADDQIIGFDAFTCTWCAEDAAMRAQGLTAELSAEELHAWLRSHQYGYFIVGGMEARQYGQDAVNNLVQAFSRIGGVSVPYQNAGAIIFRVS